MFHFMSKQAQVEIPLEARKASLLGSGRTYDYWIKLIEKYIKYIFIFQQTGSQVNLQRVVTVVDNGSAGSCLQKGNSKEGLFSSRPTVDRNIQRHNTFILAPTWMINSIGSAKPPRTKLKVEHCVQSCEYCGPQDCVTSRQYE